MRLGVLRPCAVLAVALALSACSVAPPVQSCVEVGQWVVPDPHGPRVQPVAAIIAAQARRSVVLLGELHDRADHHRWQLHTLAALHAQRQELVLGFEMFPRRVQPALDRWVAGELTEAQFLAQSDWANVWGYAAADYLPLFHFARMHRLPMLALNVERSLVREIARDGYDAVPEARREGIGRAAPAPPVYEQQLLEVYRQHPTGGEKSAEAGREDPGFRRFVQGQLVWDRAMAEAIRSALGKYPGRQVVAVLGRGHTAAGAVPFQLADLGVTGVGVLLPWEAGGDCAAPRAGVADAVFGVEAPESAVHAQPSRPRLGVMLSAGTEGGVRIDAVSAASLAEAAGLQRGDVLLMAAGKPMRTTADVQQVIGRQAPGTWLPLRVRRGVTELDLIAKFPPE